MQLNLSCILKKGVWGGTCHASVEKCQPSTCMTLKKHPFGSARGMWWAHEGHMLGFVWMCSCVLQWPRGQTPSCQKGTDTRVHGGMEKGKEKFRCRGNEDFWSERQR